MSPNQHRLQGPIFFYIFTFSKGSSQYNIRHVTHQIVIPEREESHGVIKIRKFHISCAKVTFSLIFQKSTHNRKVQEV